MRYIFANKGLPCALLLVFILFLSGCNGESSLFSSSTSSAVSNFYWNIESNIKISIGQTRQEIEKALGESPEGSSAFSDPSTGMYRLQIIYETAGGLGIDYNRKGEAVTFVEGTADLGIEVKGCFAGIGNAGEILIVPEGETQIRSFVTGELRVNPSV